MEQNVDSENLRSGTHPFEISDNRIPTNKTRYPTIVNQNAQTPNLNSDSNSEPVTVRHLIKCAVKRSSIRGLSKSINSNNCGLRVLWTVSSISLVSLGIIHVIMLIMDYYKEDTRINYSILQKDEVPFPSLTVCRSKTLSTKDVQQLLNNSELTPFLYRNRIQDMIAKTDMTHDEKKYVIRLLLNNVAYYENLSPRYKDSFYNNTDLSILNATCSVTYRNLSSKIQTVQAPCNIKLVPVIGFINCYEIQAPVTSHIIELTFMLILEKDDELNCWQCIPESMTTYKNGIFMKLHSPNESVLELESATYIPSGSQTEVFISKKKFQLLCSKNEPSSLTYYHKGEKKTEQYLATNCEIIQAHRQMSQDCSCGFSLFSPEHFPPCLQQNLSGLTLNLTRLKCVQHQSKTWPFYKTATNISSTICPKNCKFNGYQEKYTIDKLRYSDSILNLYEYLHNEIRIVDKNEIYEEIISLRNSGNSENLTRARYLLKHKAIDLLENVVLVTVRHTQPDVVISEEEVLTINFQMLLSQIGGALSLYAGVTVVCLVEVLEFFIGFFKWVKVRCGSG